MYCGKRQELIDEDATGIYYSVFVEAENDEGERSVIEELSFSGDSYDIDEEAEDVVLSVFDLDGEAVQFFNENSWCQRMCAYVEMTVLDQGSDVTPEEEDRYFCIWDYPD